MSLTTVIERSKTDREGWKYTSLAPLAAQKFSPAKAKAPASYALPSIVADAGERHQIVFLNGEWQPGMSQLGELKGLFTGNTESGYHLKLGGQTCLVTAPVELVFKSEAGAAPTETNLRLTIELGESCRLTLIEHHIASTGTQPVAAVMETEIRLGPQSKLVHGKIVDIGNEASSLAQTSVTIAEGAYYDNFVLITDGKLVRNEIEAKLTGKLAQCSLNAVMLLRGSSHADTTTHIRHDAPDGSSRQICKSVITDKSRGVFQGNITVAEGAQKTDAQQLSRALLLSDQAEMDAKPELKIYADDVKCSHGASIGALDDDALFYLRTRGLNEAEARALLIRGFAGEILNEIHMPEWRDYARAQVEAWCDEQN